MYHSDTLDIHTILWYPFIRTESRYVSVPKEDTVTDKDDVEASVLHAFEVTLEAQLKAIKRLRSGQVEEKKPSLQGKSQIEMVYDILQGASQPLHVSEIIERVRAVHGKQLERESIVSALTKKVRRGDRFVRTDKNVFGLKGGK
jgi:hypothetical protein